MADFYDIILAGGGLASGLLAYRLLTTHPHLKILILEKGETLGGNHTWSFHSTDLSETEKNWVLPLVSASWGQYEVFFKKYSRKFDSTYNSIRSSDFHDRVSSLKGLQIKFQSVVEVLTQTQVTTSSGEVFKGRCVLDGRGFFSSSEYFGYQKFVGVDVTLEDPHNLVAPVLMDATLVQEDGYRFIYCLPWHTHSLLIEDTYYSNSPYLDVDKCLQEIRHYAKSKNWKIRSEDRMEKGSLPIPLSNKEWGGDTEREVPAIGVRAGLFNPTTGYSFSEAVHLASALEIFFRNSENISALKVSHFMKMFCANKKQSGKYFRFLNRMLFYAANDSGRLLVMERFYSLPEGLIQRFYAGKLTFSDQVRILIGKPPVSVKKAFVCLFKNDGLTIGN